MSKSTTPSFVCEIPLRTTPAQERVLNVRLEAGRQVYNACLAEARKRAGLLRESRAYRKALRLPKGKERTKAFKAARKAVGFTKSALERYAVRLRRRAFHQHLDAHAAQKLAARAYDAVDGWLLGKRGRPRFKGKNQFDTLEGKTNKAGLRFRQDRLEWRGLVLKALIDSEDPVVAHALASRVKFVRLVRRKIRGKHRFSVQLVCEGRPYQKPERKVSEGVVGLDIGPSTVAAVGESGAFLELLAEGVVRKHKAIRRLQRKLDRQRRANNPENYLPDGRIRPGPKAWRQSNRQKRTEAALAELMRREAAHRKTLHGALANRVLALGRFVKLERVPYRAYQRRFGRSVSLRAPGLFVSTLRRKAASAGGGVHEFPPHRGRLSQTCHACGRVRKKPLSLRVHRCSCGLEMQRDLYSAFLARFVDEEGALHADQAREAWSGAEPLLRAAWSEATAKPASGRAARPSSFGPKPRSQSGSPAKEGIAETEARDAVAPLRGSESPGEVEVVPLRTPRL